VSFGHGAFQFPYNGFQLIQRLTHFRGSNATVGARSDRFIRMASGGMACWTCCVVRQRALAVSYF
jgi:hypothetical protein